MNEKTFFDMNNWYEDKNIKDYCGIVFDDDDNLELCVFKKSTELLATAKSCHTDMFTLLFLIPGFSQDLLDNFEKFKTFYALSNRDVIEERCRRLPYKSFLNTQYWKYIRQDRLAYANNKCSLCGKQQRLNVHHRTYEHHGREIEYPNDLIVLCSDCHAKFHDKLIEEK